MSKQLSFIVKVSFSSRFKFHIMNPSSTPFFICHELSIGIVLLTISGHTYSGYHITVRNVNDQASDTAEVDIKIAELHPNYWYLVYMKGTMKNGDVFIIEVTELTLA